jgi:hypothetical protein
VLDNYPSPINPLGAKGAGEGGIIAAGGCMANAVANALSSFGVQPRELPLSPTYIWKLVRAGQRKVAESRASPPSSLRKKNWVPDTRLPSLTAPAPKA